jgi:serine/threonine protein kinase
MSHTLNLHPTQAELQAFDSGQLAAGDCAAIEQHLAVCPACCRALDTAPQGALEAMLRSFAGPVQNAELVHRGMQEAPAELIGHPRYRVLEVLGRGGMGVVYKAIHRLMDRVVALKVLNRDLTARPGFAERFRREVKAAARLAHPNIVTAHDADESGGVHFLVMEHVAGETLAAEVARRGPVPVREACDWIRQAALGLQHAHERGMVHCDIKPHNLVLTPTGQVKILDFGLARVLGDGGAGPSLPSGTVLGTPDYVAPEQARDPAQVDIRADIYSLGCTLYHLLTGRPPFATGTPLQKLLAHQEAAPVPLASVRGDVPDPLTRIVDRMLAKDPRRRYPTPAQVAADLVPLVDPESTPTVAVRHGSRWRTFRFAASAAAIALLAFGTYFGLLRQSPDAQPHVPPAVPPAANRDPLGLIDAAEAARLKSTTRDDAAEWLRANNTQPPQAGLVDFVVSRVDQDAAGAEAFQVLLGPGLTKSAKATLLVGRAGALHVLELSGAIGDDVPAGACRVQNYSAGNERRRAAPRILLSEFRLDRADCLFAERPLDAKVAYRIVHRWQGEYALRLTYYFGKRHRHVVVRRDRLPETEEGTLALRFAPLDDADQVVPGPDAVFVEALTQEAGQTVVESNAASAAVRVMPPAAPRPD